MGNSVLRFLNKFGLFLRVYDDSSTLNIHHIYYNVDGERVKEYYSQYPDRSGIEIWFKFNKTGFKWKARIPVGFPRTHHYVSKFGYEDNFNTKAFISIIERSYII